MKETWADLVPNLHIISDTVDESIPTEVLPYTVNTKTGHCNKTRTFLNRSVLPTKVAVLSVY